MRTCEFSGGTRRQKTGETRDCFVTWTPSHDKDTDWHLQVQRSFLFHTMTLCWRFWCVKYLKTQVFRSLLPRYFTQRRNIFKFLLTCIIKIAFTLVLFTVFQGLVIYQFLEINTFKYPVFAPMGRFQLELIYLYFPPSFHLTDGSTVENKRKLILTEFFPSVQKQDI